MLPDSQIDHDTGQGLRRLFGNSDTLDHRRFTVFHKTVLGLVLVKLSTIIEAMLRSRVNKADASGPDGFVLTPIRGDVEKTRILLPHGANPNVAPKKGAQSAACARSCDCVRLLRNAGVHVDFYGVARKTALQTATINGVMDVAEIFLEHGACVDGKL